jgi:DNA-binding MarR family transcriptional regulator
VKLQPADSTTADPHAIAGELRVVLGQLQRRLRAQGDLGDFTRSQLSVLARLERDGPSTMTNLARAEGVRPQSMSAIVAVLEGADLITGAADPADGRKTLLSLTEKAREQFASGRLAREDWLFRAIQTEFAPAEQEALMTCLDVLRRLANSPGQ